MCMVCSFAQVLFLFSSDNFDAPDSDRPCFWKTLLRAREAFAAAAGIAKMGNVSPGARLGFLPGSSERRRASVFATGLRYPICGVHERTPDAVLSWRRTRGEGASG